MNSFLKSMRAAIEIFGLPLLATSVMLLYTIRPAGGTKQSYPLKTQNTGIAPACLNDSGPVANQEIHSYKHQFPGLLIINP